MSSFKIITLPGDGTGPEVMEQALKCLKVVEESSHFSFDIEEIACGGQYYLKEGSRDWPEGSEEKCRQADLILLGAVGWPDPSGSGPVTMKNGRMAGYSPVIGNRVNLNLYANMRPVKLYEGVTHRVHGQQKQVWDPECVDMVFVRENTEGLYVPAGGGLDRGGERIVATDTRIVTREGCDQVIRFAFELCRRRNKGAPKDGQLRVTCIAKDNVMEGCRLFKKRFLEIGEEYPEIEKDTAIVDAFTQWLITGPEHYDVLVAPNMFGDIVTDLASVLQGGMGLAAGANVGNHHGMFEPIHGSAPKYAGQDKVNPIAMIMALKEGLEWLGYQKNENFLIRASEALESSVVSLIKEGKTLTYDMVGESKAHKCSEVGDAIAALFSGKLSSI